MTNRVSLRLRATLCSIAAGLVGSAAHAAEPADLSKIADPAARCEAINLLNLETVAENPARVVQTAYNVQKAATARETTFFRKRGISQGNPTPGGMKTFPDHCLVEGYITPHVQFSLMLPPPDKWNGKFYFGACDAWCGKVHTDIAVPGLYDGYAAMTNNGGHYSRAPFDGIWAHNDLEARRNFAYLANHTSAQVGKAIARAYYGDAVKYSYIAGFSKGGNAGLMAAQRYPEDFDGILVKAPVVPYNVKNAVHLPWIAKSIYPESDSKPIMYSDKAPLIEAAVLAACDKLDGLEDGVIDDPRRCKFDPGILLCKAGQSEIRNECLNAAQVNAVRRMHSDPHDENGKPYLNMRIEYSTESDWARAFLPVRGSDELPFTLTAASSGLRYMVMEDNPGPDYDWRSFSYPRDADKLKSISEMMDPDDVDLTAFKKRGGKIIIVHGWSDALISPRSTIEWFEAMTDAMGGRKAVAEFAQLYLVPGMHHGSGGHGPNVFESQTALENWVEKGIAPTMLMMQDEPDHVPYRERPAYPYPDYTRYKGKGDPNLASSYKRITLDRE